MIQRYITYWDKGRWYKLYLGVATRGKLIYWNGVEYITKIFRIRKGNGIAGTVVGEEIHDLYDPYEYEDPNTPDQQTQRAKLTTAMAAWAALTPEQKEVYNIRAKTLRFVFGRTLFTSEHMLT